MFISLWIALASTHVRPTPRSDDWVEAVGCRLAEEHIFVGLPMSESPASFGRYEFSVAVYATLVDVQIESKESLRLALILRKRGRWRVEARRKLSDQLGYLERWTGPAIREFVLLERELAPILQKLGADSASLYPLVDRVVHLPSLLKSLRLAVNSELSLRPQSGQRQALGRK